MELARKQVIDNLSSIMDSMPDDACGEWRDSLAYAISSLKTDEMYQLDYEGVQNIVVTEGMTNGDVVQMLFPKTQVTELKSRIQVIGENYIYRHEYPKDWWDRSYKLKGE